jgi:hypothetical protein
LKDVLELELNQGHEQEFTGGDELNQGHGGHTQDLRHLHEISSSAPRARLVG